MKGPASPTRPRCFGRLSDDEHIDLEPDEADHLLRVLRVSLGDQVEVVDGQRLLLAEVAGAGRRELRLRWLGELEPEQFDAVPIRLCVAVLHPPAMERLMRLATELHVARLTLLRTERTQHQIVAPRILERWQRVAREACKQARRMKIPSVEAPVSLDSLLVEAAPPNTLRLALTPHGATIDASGLSQFPQPPEIWLAQGPEGGWTARELEMMLGAGWLGWTLGRAVFRAETCAAVALSLLHQTFGGLFSPTLAEPSAPSAGDRSRATRTWSEPHTGVLPELPAD